MTGLDDVRAFIAWKSGSGDALDIDESAEAFQHLIDLVIVVEQLISDREQVRLLPPHWKAAAATATNIDERETLLLCAEQLSMVLFGRPE